MEAHCENPPTDHELMLRVREGRLDELGELFERHHLRLYNFFLRLTGSRPASEDLVQEVFCRILSYRRSYFDHGDFLSWLYRLARNVGNDHFRKRGRPQEQGGDDRLGDLVCERRLPPEEIESTEAVERLRHALLRLPVEKREVLILARFQGLKYEQVGELLGCKVGAVKVRVHRAVKQLRELYYQMAEEPSPAPRRQHGTKRCDHELPKDRRMDGRRSGPGLEP